MRVLRGIIWGSAAAILLLVSLLVSLSIVANVFFGGNVGWDPVALFGPGTVYVVVVGVPLMTFGAGFIYGLRRHRVLRENSPRRGRNIGSPRRKPRVSGIFRRLSPL